MQYTYIMKTYEIKYLICANGSAPVLDWLDSLDNTIRKRIVQRILRIEEGNFGDTKKLSDDISELRFSFGKGYRVYYTQTNNTIVLLVNCGDKSAQAKDIEKAHKLLDEWRSKHE